MYSGFTITRFSGRILGTHQKIDKVARKQLALLIKKKGVFPSATSILVFEGKNGPDAIKRKSPARDEPWHYFSPFDEDDSRLIELIKDHYKNLVSELKGKNSERVAFESAWLAHALVDGLTPAHHYPYEQKLIEIGGESIENRTSIRKKWFPKGLTPSATMRNTWKMWGPKGLISTHSYFEFGVAILMAPLSAEAPNITITQKEIDDLRDNGIIEMFRNTAREVAVLGIYDTYMKKGWTPRLAYEIRQKLYPALVKTVALAWYSALVDAEIVKLKK